MATRPGTFNASLAS